MLLLIDNFDSFTCNISQAFESLGQEVIVVRNRSCTAQECLAMRPDFIVIGPGPGAPKQTGICKELVSLNKEIPLLGICMGHQVIGEVFGGTVGHARRPMHGKTSQIFHRGAPLFAGIESGFLAMRYHSLAIREVPDCLEITAWTQEGEVMGIVHKTLPLEGVQFHPDSIGTPCGLKIFQNYITKSLPK
ncbi:MAG: anthranilate synthase component II [Chlamydiales bacterium]